MKANKPSRTAHFVALGRALANAGLSHVPAFSDPTAQSFLNDEGKKSLAKTTRAFQQQQDGVRINAARVMANLIALRTAAIDEAVRTAIAGGATQLVILGAGYDGRAWRMPELAGIRVFEVDHPATQQDKRDRTANLPATNAVVHFVAMDFERDSLDAVLQRAGHGRSRPTCWIWEGVVMYLTHEAMHATLAHVAKRSAPGSTLVVNYHTVHRGFVARMIFRFIGEPQISAWTPEEMAHDLRSVGYIVRKDSGMADWNMRFAGGHAFVERGSYMRIAVAVNSRTSTRDLHS